MLVGHFHTDRGLARDRGEDADRLRAHAERDVFIEAGDLLDTDAGRRRHFVTCDDGTDMDLAK